jgi:acetyl-CoA carboxylase biotin carboxyl carrier protein
LSLNAKEVAEILKALEASGFDTLDLEMGGVKLSLRRSGASATTPPAGHGAMPATTPTLQPVAAPAAAPASGPIPMEVPAGTQPVSSPLLGVFYRAPKPGEAPYVETGQHVEADTIIGIIEVMKLMNTVRAGIRGEIVAIPARNGELVEYGEALLFVRPD